jgi:hypothetical protein
VAADGRIARLTEVSGHGRRSVAPLYYFNDEQRLRDVPYLDRLETMWQEISLTAHKVRHGDLRDEPDTLPILRRLLAGIEDAAETFRRANEARESRKSDT